MIAASAFGFTRLLASTPVLPGSFLRQAPLFRFPELLGTGSPPFLAQGVHLDQELIDVLMEWLRSQSSMRVLVGLLSSQERHCSLMCTWTRSPLRFLLE